MKFADEPDLPFCLKRAVEHQASIYNDAVTLHLKEAGDYDFQVSVTTLNKSPRQNHLFRRHSKDIVQTYWNRLHLLDGSIFHYLLESHPDPKGISEKRFGRKIKYQGNIIYLHGAADLFYPEDGILIDFKRASVISRQFPKDDYIFQLNALKWIIDGQNHTYKVKSLRNIFSYKDWSKREAVKPNYPNRPIETIEHPIWTTEKIQSELSSRLKAHFNAKDLSDNDLPYCTPEQQWRRNKHRVIARKKDGEWSKASKGTYDSLDEAEARQSEVDCETKVETITGTPIKCRDYCDCALFCNQFELEQQQQQQNTDTENED